MPRTCLLEGKVGDRFLVGHDLPASFRSNPTEEAEAFCRERAPWEENQAAARLRFNTYEHTLQTDGVSPVPPDFIGTVTQSRPL